MVVVIHTHSKDWVLIQSWLTFKATLWNISPQKYNKTEAFILITGVLSSEKYLLKSKT